MAEVERKETYGGRAILTWDTAVARNAGLRFRYSFAAGFAGWAMWYLWPTQRGQVSLPGSFSEWVWLVMTSLLSGLATAGVVALVAVWATHRNWLRDYWLDTMSVTERTQSEPERQPLRHAPNGRIHVPSQSGGRVTHGEHSYTFTARQLRLMIDRIEDDNLSVARDAFEIETAAYPQVRMIMAQLGYWQEGRAGHNWTEAGVSWLRNEMRIL